jgi:hypothetical protein
VGCIIIGVNAAGASMMRHRWLAVLIAAVGSLVSCPGAEAQDISWSGYVLKSANLDQATPPTTFTAVSAKWKQPTVTCPVANAEVSFWVGIDGTGTSTVEQAGTLATCSTANKPPVYKVFWEMFAPNNESHGGENLTISPGDMVDASVDYLNGSYTLKLTDTTSGHSLSTTQACGASAVCKRATAEWIVERPGGGKYPLAAYGTVEFTNLGVTSSGPSPTHSEVNMDQSGTTLSTCSAVAPAGGPGSDPSHPIVDLASALTCKWVAAQ